MEDFEQARERVVEVLRVHGAALSDDTDVRLVYRALGGRLRLPSDAQVLNELLTFDDASRMASSLAEEFYSIHDARAFVTRSLGYMVRAVPPDQSIDLRRVRERLRQVEAGNDRIQMLEQTAIRTLQRIFDLDLSV